jgi:superfamily I DNA/RNA helicase
MGNVVAPLLEGDARAAVEHRGSHLQIIAAAGSGKTEVVSQRVAGVLAEGLEPAGVVAFTFTERAAAELRHRIAERAEERLGPGALDVSVACSSARSTPTASVCCRPMCLATRPSTSSTTTS